jgi:hypothetical protein
MSYVDDGTFIVSSWKVEDNLPLLKEAYGFVHNAFSSLGLVLEHDKSEAFHFSHAQRFSNPAIDLGFAPYGEATPLKPKPIWRYLGFFFDRKLLFREHVRFYSTKAFTTVKPLICLLTLQGASRPSRRDYYTAPVSYQSSCTAFVYGTLKEQSSKVPSKSWQRRNKLQLFGSQDASACPPQGAWNCWRGCYPCTSYFDDLPRRVAFAQPPSRCLIPSIL